MKGARPWTGRAALILGAAVHAAGPSPTLRRRTLHAAGLWAAGAVDWLVPCGGLGRHPPTEAAAMRAVLLAAGVPDGAIHLEGQSTNTVENIALALPILRGLGCDNVVLVTDRTHARRALLIARRLGLDAIASCPGPAPWQVALRQSLREVPATALTLWRLRRHPLGLPAGRAE